MLQHPVKDMVKKDKKIRGGGGIMCEEEAYDK